MKFQMINIINDGMEQAFFDRAKGIILRKFSELGNVSAGEGYKLVLKNAEGIPEDGYRVEKKADGVIVHANTKLGWLSGAGRVMQEGAITEEGFEPGAFEGLFEPAREVYGTYFATHFGNYYMNAPLDEIERYIEDLSLWGQRLQRIWFDFHTYTGIDDPAAQPVLERELFILKVGQDLGMRIAFVALANEGYITTPEELKAEWWVQGKYHSEPRGHYHVEICPSKPGGTELILKNRRSMYERFKHLKPYLLSFSVYDQGGCTCEKCAPYGGKAYLDLVKKLAPLAHEYFPEARLCLTGWYLDKFVDGEWKMMYDRLENETDLADQMTYMCGVNTNSLPKDIPENAQRRKELLSGVGPGNTRLLGFPEISMQGCTPWGGFGANPYPERLQKDWDMLGCKQAGMWSYSEGRFEDINKVIVMGLYSGRYQTAQDAMRAYVKFELSPEYTDEIMDILNILEETLQRTRVNPDRTQGIQYSYDAIKDRAGAVRFVIEKPERVEEAMRKVQSIHERLPERIRNSWRWQLVYLRAMADWELVKADFKITEACEKYLEQLDKLYYVGDNTLYGVSPATRKAIAKRMQQGMI